jgi:hypothetical protein
MFLVLVHLFCHSKNVVLTEKMAYNSFPLPDKISVNQHSKN